MLRYPRILLVVLPVVFAAWFAWGYHLYGIYGGTSTGILVAGILFLNLRHFRQRPPRTATDFATITVSLGLIICGTWPSLVNDNYAREITRYQSDRAAVNAIKTVLQSDPAFQDLHLTHHRRKILLIRIRGNVETTSHVEKLQQHMPPTAPTLAWVSWKITTRDTGNLHEDNMHLKPPNWPAPPTHP